MTAQNQLITDDQSLVSASSRFDSAIATYDNGFGPLWIHRNSLGISGIVRARTWHEAYEICEDEFFPATDADAWEEQKKIEAMPEGKDRDHEQACWDEAYGWRSNSRREKDGTLSSLYAKDLNGDVLDGLTPALLAELEIKLVIQANE